jgi:hypothetical protein
MTSSRQRGLSRPGEIFVCERLLKRIILRNIGVAEPDPVSDLGFMTQKWKQFTVIKNASINILFHLPQCLFSFGPFWIQLKWPSHIISTHRDLDSKRFFYLSLCVLVNPRQSASFIVVIFFNPAAITQKRSTVGTSNCIVSCRTKSNRIEIMQVLDFINKYRYDNFLKNFFSREIPSDE